MDYFPSSSNLVTGFRKYTDQNLCIDIFTTKRFGCDVMFH